MLNENLNNMHWKDKLEDAGNLPGEILQNKNAVWKKLNSRLRQKPRRRSVAGFWAVAASLILAILIPLFRAHNNANKLVLYTTKKGAATTPLLKDIEPVKLVAVIAPAQTKKQKKEIFVSEKIIAHTNINTAKKEESINNDNVLVKIESRASLPRADSALAPAIETVKTIKKLRVIHINELGEVAEESPQIARATEQHIFQIKLANEEIFTNSSIAVSKTSLPFFKSKTSPSN